MDTVKIKALGTVQCLYQWLRLTSGFVIHTAVKSEHLYVFLTKCNAYNSVCLIFKNIFQKHFYFDFVFLFVLSF